VVPDGEHTADVEHHSVDDGRIDEGWVNGHGLTVPIARDGAGRPWRAGGQ
jgi:hypothetical protein